MVAGTALVLAVAAGAAVSVTTSAVQVRAAVEGAAAIRLDWSTYGSPPVTAWQVQRKRLADPTWTSTLVGFGAGSTERGFLDATVVPGETYEYRVQLASTSTDYHGAWGTACAGIAVPPVHARGRVLLVVDETVAGPLALEIERFRRDLIGDGWRVTTLTAPRHVAYPTTAGSWTEATNPAAILKGRLRDAVDADPDGATRAVILLGHVQVPYSGWTGYDGHGSRAFPTDVYYGNFADAWTDTTVNNTTWTGSRNDAAAPAAEGARNDNVPGDGKFDRSSVSANRLYVGRIDTAAMGNFGEEVALLRRYLEKNHRWRRGLLPAGRGAVYYEKHDGDVFFHGNPALRRGLPALYPASSLAADGAVLPGPDHDYLPAAVAAPWEWVSVGSSGGNNGIGGMHGAHLAHLDVQGVFFGLYGSFIGDWDQANNLLRAVVAAPRYGLAAYLGGQGTLHLAPMAMGRPLGEAQLVRLDAAPANPHRDPVNGGARQGAIWHNLFGDPTLGLAPLPPPRHPRWEGVVLRWDEPVEAVDGYYVYAAASIDSPFTLLTPDPLSGPGYAAFPQAHPPGTVFMVRAVKLVAPYTGSYHALSQGVFSDANPNGPPLARAGADRRVYDTLAVPLAGEMADDGFPGGALTGRWTVVEGPDTVVFADPAAPTTTATFASGGRYVLAFTAEDGELADTDTVVVDVSADVRPAVEGTWVDERSPDSVRGGAFQNELRSGPPEASQRRFIHLIFDLGYAYRRADRAVLRMRTYTGNVAGGRWDVHAVADATWDEGALTWATAPALDPVPLATSRLIAANETDAWVDIDLGEALRGRTGRVALALVTDSANLIPTCVQTYNN